MLSPANSISHALPSTTSSAVAVNTSGMRVRATTRNSCRSSTRPPNTSAAIASSAFNASQPIGWVAPADMLPINGIAASSGIAARSWNNRMAKPRRPCSLVSALRSASSCSPIAVDDNARPPPTMTAALAGSPNPTAIAPSSSPDTSTCNPPAPNTGLRITRSRAGDSSSPITNSSITTPIWLAASTGSALATIRNPNGPSTTPAAR